MATTIPLLVVSCDRYSDLWSPFFAILAKRWPDCPFPLYLGTNHKTFDARCVTSLPVGQDKSWADGLRMMLSQLNSEFVLVFLDDFFLTGTPDTREIVRLGRTAVDRQLGCLRLRASPGPSKSIAGEKDLGEIRVGDPYRVSTQVAFWHTETLMKLLVPGYSAWDFEVLGSANSAALPAPFWSVRRTQMLYQHAVERGQWLPEVQDSCRAVGVDIDSGARPTWPRNQRHRSRLGRLKGAVFFRLPHPIRRWFWRRMLARFVAERARHP